jgi:hypothetical protein
MVLTRANVEADLIDRTGAFLTVVGKDGTTVDGTNVNLNFPDMVFKKLAALLQMSLL